MTLAELQEALSAKKLSSFLESMGISTQARGGEGCQLENRIFSVASSVQVSTNVVF